MGVIGSKDKRNHQRVGKSVTSLFVLTPVLWAALPLTQGVDKAFASTGKWVDITNGSTFNGQWGTAVDQSSGDVFVTNALGGTVFKLAKGSTTWTDITYSAGFSHPLNIAVEQSSGDVFATDVGNNEIYKLAKNHTSWTPITPPSASVLGIAADNNGNLFVSDGQGGIYEELANSKTWLPITNTYVFFSPYGIAVDSSGNLFVADRGKGKNTVSEWNAATKTWSDISAGGSFKLPNSIAVDSYGNVFVANYGNYWDYMIEEGHHETNNTWTWTDVTNGGSFQGPEAVAVDTFGDLFVTNNYSRTIPAVFEYVVPHPINPFSIGTNWAWNAQYGVPYNNLQLQAASGHEQDTWSIVNGSLPAGLTLSSDGIISGTPTGENGTSTFTVQVKDASGQTATKTLSISVFGVHNLQVATSSLSSGVVGQSYQSKLSAVGGQGSYVWKVAQGKLPTGVTLSADGSLAGTPQKPGTYTFTVQTFDALGDSAAQYYVLNVANSKH